MSGYYNMGDNNAHNKVKQLYNGNNQENGYHRESKYDKYNNYNKHNYYKESELDNIRDNINEDKMLDVNRESFGNMDDINEYGDEHSRMKVLIAMAIMAVVIVGAVGMAIFKSSGSENIKRIQASQDKSALITEEASVGDVEVVGDAGDEIKLNEEQIEDTGDSEITDVKDGNQDPGTNQDPGANQDSKKLDNKATKKPTPTPKPTKDPAIVQQEVKEKIRKLSESDERVVGIYNNFNRYPLNLMKDIIRNHEMIDYTVGYLDGIGQSYDENIDISNNINDTTYKIPLLIQWDTRWGYYKYGKSTVGISGCGPTALNMVYLAFTGDSSMNPLKMAKFSTDNGYCVPGVGTSWSLMIEGANKLGLTSARLSNKESKMKESLEQGKLIIASMGPGTFTETGHFIVFSGYENGKFRINDPFSMAHSKKSWKYSEFGSQIKALWVLSR